jgi:hypothetical protein
LEPACVPDDEPDCPGPLGLAAEGAIGLPWAPPHAAVAAATATIPAHRNALFMRNLLLKRSVWPLMSALADR